MDLVQGIDGEGGVRSNLSCRIQGGGNPDPTRIGRIFKVNIGTIKITDMDLAQGIDGEGAIAPNTKS